MLKLHDLMRSLKRRLQVLFGSRIEVLWIDFQELVPIHGESTWIEDIIFEMAVRARAAMPYGGRLVIETANIEVDHNFDGTKLKFGRYAMVEMTCLRQTPSRPSELNPTPTLFMMEDYSSGDFVRAQRMILSLGGEICEYNEPGRALTIRAFFPSARQIDCTTQEAHVTAESNAPRILVVEDESYVLDVAYEILDSEGYQVFTAHTAKEALAIFSENGPVHLLLTDLLMPGMDGQRLSTELKALHPELKTIYMSGYTEAWLARFDQKEVKKAFLQKPFTMESLTTKVREVLEASPGSC